MPDQQPTHRSARRQLPRTSDGLLAKLCRGLSRGAARLSELVVGRSLGSRLRHRIIEAIDEEHKIIHVAPAKGGFQLQGIQIGAADVRFGSASARHGSAGRRRARIGRRRPTAAGQLDRRSLGWLFVLIAPTNRGLPSPLSLCLRLCTRPLIHQREVAPVSRHADDSGLIRHAIAPMQHTHCSERPHSVRPLLARPQDERNAACRHHDRARGCHCTFLVTSDETLVGRRQRNVPAIRTLAPERRRKTHCLLSSSRL